jgi:hypothetical protein
MKFTEGMWRFKVRGGVTAPSEFRQDVVLTWITQSGLTSSWVGHVERYSQDGDEVKALLTAVQRHRGDQLNQRMS